MGLEFYVYSGLSPGICTSSHHMLHTPTLTSASSSASCGFPRPSLAAARLPKSVCGASSLKKSSVRTRHGESGADEPQIEAADSFMVLFSGEERSPTPHTPVLCRLFSLSLSLSLCPSPILSPVSPKQGDRLCVQSLGLPVALGGEGRVTLFLPRRSMQRRRRNSHGTNRVTECYIRYCFSRWEEVLFVLCLAGPSSVHPLLGRGEQYPKLVAFPAMEPNSDVRR